MGIADTKRFFHQGLLRSDFSSSLSFLSSTWRNKNSKLWRACFDITDSNQATAYLSFQGVLAGRGGRSQAEGAGGLSLFNRYPPVEARVACGPPARADDVRAAAADEPVWEGVALLVVFQISLGQAVGHEERVANVLAQHAGFRDGRIRWRMSGPGVVHFRPHYCSSWGASGRDGEKGSLEEI